METIPSISMGLDSFNNEDETLESASSKYSREYNLQLKNLKMEVEKLADWKPDIYSLLSMEDSSTNSGHTLPFHGIITIHPKFFRPGNEKIEKALAVHERVHLHLGGELRRQVFENNPIVDKFFHEKIVPEWLAGKISFPYPDRDFIQAKDWMGLSTTWNTLDVQLSDCVSVLRRYFLLLEKGHLRFNGENIDFQTNPEDEMFAKFFSQLPVVSLEEQFKMDQNKFLKALITGYSLGDYLFQSSRSALEFKLKRNFWENEEGFANFIAMDITGISEKEIQSQAPQDDGKFFLARKLKLQCQGTAKELLSKISDYPQFNDFLMRKL